MQTMVEFNGYIYGTAEKRFRKRSRTITQNALLISLLIVSPAIVYLAIELEYMLIIVAYCAMFIIVPLLVRIPQNRNSQKALTPKKIIIKDKQLICIADKYTESKWISDVKLVKDFGEFYEIIFHFGKLSEKFICQKSLLTKGSLGEFEKIFKGKLHKTGDGLRE